MAINIPFSGSIYSIPSQAERNWASNVNSYLQALGANSLPRAGGAFSLSSDLDLGATATIYLKAVASKTANAAATGFVRLANTDTLSWRNFANSADLALGVNTSNRLTFDSVVVPTISSADTLTNKTLTTPVIGDASSIVAASASVPGIVTTGTQTLAGAKTFNSNFILAAATPQILTDTPNGADNKLIAINGGGDSSATRGSQVTVYGNEVATNGGRIIFSGGDSVTSSGSANAFVWNASATTGGASSTVMSLTGAGSLALTANDSTVRSANGANNAGAFIGHRQSDGTAIWGALGSSAVVFRVNSADVGGIATTGAHTWGSTASNQNHLARGLNVYVRNSDGTQMGMGVTGSTTVLDSFGQDNSTNASVSFRTLRNDGSNTIVYMSASAGGIVTIGPTNNSLTHTVNGANLNLQTSGSASASLNLRSTGGNSALSFNDLANGTPNRFNINYIQSTDNLRISNANGSSDLATASQAGAWTFGSSSSTSLHVFQGRLNVQGNIASAGGGVASNNSKLLINGDSASTASASTLHLGDNSSGTSRQWAIVNGRTATSQAAGCLAFIVANAANTDPFNGSGAAPLSIYTGGIQLATSGGTASLLNYYEENSFTGSATGFTTTPAPIIYYTRIGKTVTLNISSFSATSNSVNFTITGLPARLSPAREINQLCIVSDNGAFQATPGYCNIAASGTTLTFYRNTAGNNFTASGVKGLTFTTITYQLA